MVSISVCRFRLENKIIINSFLCSIRSGLDKVLISDETSCKVLEFVFVKLFSNGKINNFEIKSLIAFICR